LAIYSKAFYAIQRFGSRRSAEVILPIVFDAVRPQSVVDVGCGVGTWLAVARRLGINQTLGLEGEWVLGLPYADPKLEIRGVDLEKKIPDLGKFDLVTCMEVAEHLTPGRAEGFVADLCSLSDHVFFSAAIPWQGGTNHLNERPQSYWAGLFARQGFGARDIVRPKVWNNSKASYWYRQNSILYSRGVATDPAIVFDRRHPVHFVTPWRIVEGWDRLRGRTSPQGQY
jgi:hypothetical protein